MGKGDGTEDSCRPNVPEMDRTESGGNIVDQEVASGRNGNINTRQQDIIDIIDSVSDTAIDEIRRQIQVEHQPFLKPKKMPLAHYQELCRALEVEKFLAPFIKSAQAPWSDLEITRLIRGRDRTYCLWVPTRHLPNLQKVVKLALQRIVADQELASYEERVSFEEMDSPTCLQRQAGGYSVVSGSMTCEYDVPGTNPVIGHENKKTTICAFLEGNSEHYFLGTSHLHNLEGQHIYYRNKAQNDDKYTLGQVVHHAQAPKPFIEAFLGKLDDSNAQVKGGVVKFDQIHDGSILELLGETVYLYLEEKGRICSGMVEYLGRGKHCEDPDTGELIDGSTLLYCRPIDCDNLSPPGSSGTGGFIRREEEHGEDVQKILAAMNLFSLLKDNQTWAVCQHIVVPIGYFREKLGCSSLTLYNGEYGKPVLASRNTASAHSGSRDVDGGASALSSYKTRHALHVVPLLIRLAWHCHLLTNAPSPWFGRFQLHARQTMTPWIPSLCSVPPVS